MEKIRTAVGAEQFAAGHYRRAASLLDEITAADDFAEFLTLIAYRDIP